MEPTNSPPSASVAAAIQDIKEAIQRAKPLSHSSGSTSVMTPGSSTSCNNSHSRAGLLDSQSHQSPVSQERVPLICDSSPVWVPR